MGSRLPQESQGQPPKLRAAASPAPADPQEDPGLGDGGVQVFHILINANGPARSHVPVWEWGASTSFDCDDPFSRRKIDRITIAPIDRNSLCQFWSDSNQNRAVPR